MADQKGIDLLMKFKTIEGDYIVAESTDAIGSSSSGGDMYGSLGLGGLSAIFDPKIAEKDPLLKGFKSGYVFEVFNFSFGTGMQWGSNEEDDEDGTLNAITSGTSGMDPKQAAALRRAFQSRDRKKKKSKKMSEWTFGQPGNVEMQPITFSRYIDQASSNILQRCFDSAYFEKVTIVKRRATGGQFAGYGFLRMDFGGVMVTQINWSDDDDVEEQVTFVCRSVQIQYKPMLPSGKLGGTIEGSWKWPAVNFPPAD